MNTYKIADNVVTLDDMGAIGGKHSFSSKGNRCFFKAHLLYKKSSNLNFLALKIISLINIVFINVFTKPETLETLLFIKTDNPKLHLTSILMMSLLEMHQSTV